MRLAVAGKGGAGKTTISATLARLAAADGRSVVAVDADANPNLSVALGIDVEAAASLRPVPPSLVSRKRGGLGLLEPIDDVLAAHTVVGPDRVRLLSMGAPAHADEGCLCSAHAVVSAVLEDLGSADRFVVVDMEASPEHLSRGTVRHVDSIFLIAEPYYRSLETVRRMAALVAELPVPHVAVVAKQGPLSARRGGGRGVLRPARVSCWRARFRGTTRSGWRTGPGCRSSTGPARTTSARRSQSCTMFCRTDLEDTVGLGVLMVVSGQGPAGPEESTHDHGRDHP